MIVKICGQTSLADAELSLRAGADWLGFIFYPKSKRAVTFEAISSWLPDLAGRTERIGVFVDAEAEEIRRIVASGLIERAQLHGNESPEFCRTLGVPYIKAIRVRGLESIEALDQFGTETILLDGPEPGSGHVFDWQVAAEAVRRYPQIKFLLAGGLTPDNVAEGIAQVNPWGVDVASGVEASPGRKDPAKLMAFLAEARRR